MLTLVLDMDVWQVVLIRVEEVHPDQDAVKSTDERHGPSVSRRV
jgi:hypothetical protein